VEDRARAQRQVEREQHHRDDQHAPMNSGKVGEELADGIEERIDARGKRC
jgi:hypothetical protein